MAHFRWPLTVFFDGEFIPGGALPWTYLPVWVLISLPEFYFITVALGFLLAIRLLITERKSGEIRAAHQNLAARAYDCVADNERFDPPPNAV